MESKQNPTPATPATPASATPASATPAPATPPATPPAITASLWPKVAIVAIAIVIVALVIGIARRDSGDEVTGGQSLSETEKSRLEPVQAALDAAYGNIPGPGGIPAVERWRLFRVALSLFAAAKADLTPPDPADTSAGTDDRQAIFTLLALKDSDIKWNRSSYVLSCKCGVYPLEAEFLEPTSPPRLYALDISTDALGVCGISVGQGWSQATGILGQPKSQVVVPEDINASVEVDYPAFGISFTLVVNPAGKSLQKLDGRSDALQISGIRVYDMGVEIGPDGCRFRD